ncbi:unnamed protein product [Malus baccata var. baccata]
MSRPGTLCPSSLTLTTTANEYGDKDDGGDEARVLDLDAYAYLEFKTGEGRDSKKIAGKMKKAEQKGEAMTAEAEDEEG